MGIQTKENEKTQRPIPPAGQTLGICIGVIDLGTQTEQFKGEAKQLKKICIIWELPAHKAVFQQEKGLQPMVVSQQYTNSLNDKGNFRKMLDSWFANPITEMPLDRAKKIPGWPAMLQIAHTKSKDGKLTYANVAQRGISVFPRSKETPVPKNENEAIYFDLDEGQFSLETFNKLPTYLQEIIKKSPEFQARTAGMTIPSAITANQDFANEGQFEDEPF